MADQDKIFDFFSKLDKSKKKTGFVTLNEITEKRQQKIEATFKKNSHKDSLNNIKDDEEWEPVRPSHDTCLVPYTIIEQSESESEVEEIQEPKTQQEVKEPEKLNLNEYVWNFEEIQQNLESEKKDTKTEDKKPKAYVPGAFKTTVKETMINEEEFPDLISPSKKKKKVKKKRSGVPFQTNGIHAGK